MAVPGLGCEAEHPALTVLPPLKHSLSKWAWSTLRPEKRNQTARVAARGLTGIGRSDRLGGKYVFSASIVGWSDLMISRNCLLLAPPDDFSEGIGAFFYQTRPGRWLSTRSDVFRALHVGLRGRRWRVSHVEGPTV